MFDKLFLPQLSLPEIFSYHWHWALLSFAKKDLGAVMVTIFLLLPRGLSEFRVPFIPSCHAEATVPEWRQEERHPQELVREELQVFQLKILLFAGWIRKQGKWDKKSYLVLFKCAMSLLCYKSFFCVPPAAYCAYFLVVGFPPALLFGTREFFSHNVFWVIYSFICFFGMCMGLLQLRTVKGR